VCADLRAAFCRASKNKQISVADRLEAVADLRPFAAKFELIINIKTAKTPGRTIRRGAAARGQSDSVTLIELPDQCAIPALACICARAEMLSKLSCR
jgi:hypothetical protein